MEPRQEAVPQRGELPPVSLNGSELNAGSDYELKSSLSVEQQQFQQSVGAAQAVVQAVAPSLTIPTVVPQSDDASTVLSDDTPIVANDDDLIEKEWVDKAKQIIAATKDDPYKREREVSKLQIEYIRRRYGREIGEPGD